MAYAIARVRHFTADPLDYARMAIVSACALALIGAGQILPV